MEITPLDEFVVLEKEEAKSENKFGIIIPEGGDIPQVNIGVVKGVGFNVSETIKKGAKVLFKPYAFEDISLDYELDGEKKVASFLIGKQDGITAILND